MSDVDPQIAPIPNNEPGIADLVIKDILAKKEAGLQKYGVPLQAFNGRNPIVDAYQEAIDLTKYLKTILEESRWHPTSEKHLPIGKVILIYDSKYKEQRTEYLESYDDGSFSGIMSGRPIAYKVERYTHWKQLGAGPNTEELSQ